MKKEKEVTTEQDYTEIAKKVELLAIKTEGIDEAIKQYEPETHDIFDIVKRPKKIVQKPTGKKDAQDKEIMSTTHEEVVRVAIPFQKLIVKRRVAFMNSGKMVLKADPKTPLEERLLKMVIKCREDNKLAYKSKEIATRMMSELHCAELWFSEDAEEGYWGDSKGNYKMRMKVLSPLLGDNLLPVFSSTGDLTHFARGFKTKNDEGKEIENLDIYTKDGFYHFEKINTSFTSGVFNKYAYGKLPTIYYRQKEAEWADVQPIIERLETTLSNLGDTNDYNGSPILAATGKIIGFSSKGERGKVIELENGADLKYVNWDNASQSTKQEIDLLINFIYTCTQTPNYTFEEMKGLGGLSGVAMDRVFIDAHLAAQDKLDGGYGECVQRQINFLKAACVAIDVTLKPALNMSITPEFTLFRIDDDDEKADFWIKASGGKSLVSQETSIEKSGFTKDTQKEMEKIRQEEAQAAPKNTANTDVKPINNKENGNS